MAIVILVIAITLVHSFTIAIFWVRRRKYVFQSDMKRHHALVSFSVNHHMTHACDSVVPKDSIALVLEVVVFPIFRAIYDMQNALTSKFGLIFIGFEV